MGKWRAAVAMVGVELVWVMAGLVLTLTLAGLGVCAGVMALQSAEISRGSAGEEVTKRRCAVRSLSFVLSVSTYGISNR